MPHLSLTHFKARWFFWLCMLLIVVGLPVGCAALQHKERELVFMIEPGTASWYHGIPDDVQDLQLSAPSFGLAQNIHAWWWKSDKKDAPAILYLHGSRWNLTGQFFRIEQLHALGFSVLAIDYRGFGESKGRLPSEASVYEDARIAWDRLKQLQPDPHKRLIYGHSLGGAVAVDLAAELGRDVESSEPVQARGLIIESTFTNLADVAASVASTRTSLPVRWLVSQKFDSIDKIADVRMPLLIVHGSADQFVSPRFSEALFQAAQEPKQLLMVQGGNHNNSMNLGREAYARAIQTLLRETPPSVHAINEPARSAKQSG